MNLERKRVLIIPLNELTKGDGLTDFSVDRSVIDKIRKMNISRVAIVYKDNSNEDFYAKVKTVEFFVFAYCKISVSTHKDDSGLMPDLMGTLPHNLRNADVMLTLGMTVDGIDNIEKEDFL